MRGPRIQLGRSVGHAWQRQAPRTVKFGSRVLGVVSSAAVRQLLYACRKCGIVGDVEGLEFALQLVSATEPPRPGPGTIELFAPYPLSDEGNMRRLASTTPELERFVTKVNQLGVDPGASDAVASGPAAQVSGDASATSRSSSATINSLHSSTVVSVTRSVITPESNVCVFEFSEARSPVALPGPSPGLDSEPLVPGVFVVCCGTSVGDMAGLQPVLTLDNCCVSATPSSLAFDVLQAVVVCTEGICVTATVAMVSNWLATALGDAKGSILANQVLVYVKKCCNPACKRFIS